MSKLRSMPPECAGSDIHGVSREEIWRNLVTGDYSGYEVKAELLVALFRAIDSPEPAGSGRP
jgi:hypothetical protein